jgi:hypothetical protein
MGLGNPALRTGAIIISVVSVVAAVAFAAVYVGRSSPSDGTAGRDAREEIVPTATPSSGNCLLSDPEGVFGGDKMEQLVSARLCVIDRAGVLANIELSEDELETLRSSAEGDAYGKEPTEACAPDGLVVDLQGTTSDGTSTHQYLPFCTRPYSACFGSGCPGHAGWRPTGDAARMVNRLLRDAGV